MSTPALPRRPTAQSNDVLARAEALMKMVEARDAASTARKGHQRNRTLYALGQVGKQIDHQIAALHHAPLPESTIVLMDEMPAHRAALVPRRDRADRRQRPRSDSEKQRMEKMKKRLGKKSGVRRSNTTLVPRSARVDADSRRHRRRSELDRIEAMKQRVGRRNGSEAENHETLVRAEGRRSVPRRSSSIRRASVLSAQRRGKRADSWSCSV